MKLVHVPVVNSTNTYLKEHYQSLPNWTVLFTDYQRKGRGRLNHIWRSHKGENLLCSILIKETKIFKEYSSLCLLVGVTIYRLLKELKINNVKIKLPNDIYVNNKKICGILLESISQGEKLKALVIGVGLNLNQKTFPKTLNATSYYLLTKKSIKVEDVLSKYLTILNSEIKKIKPNYYQRLLKQYRKVIISKR